MTFDRDETEADDELFCQCCGDPLTNIDEYGTILCGECEEAAMMAACDAPEVTLL